MTTPKENLIYHLKLYLVQCRIERERELILELLDRLKDNGK